MTDSWQDQPDSHEQTLKIQSDISGTHHTKLVNQSIVPNNQKNETSGVMLLVSEVVETLRFIHSWSWASGTFSSAINQIRFLRNTDSWTFRTEQKLFQGSPSCTITGAHGNREVPRRHFARGEPVVLGCVWDGVGIKFAFSKSPNSESRAVSVKCQAF